MTDVSEDLQIACVCVSPLAAIIFLSRHPVTCPFLGNTVSNSDKS